MSWFPDEFEACRLPEDVAGEGVAAPGQELAPGVRVERSGVFTLGRRSLIKATGAAAALMAGGGALRAQEVATPKKAAPAPKADIGFGFEAISLKDFIVQAEQLAEKLVQEKTPNEDAYLWHLASLLCRLEAAPSFTSKRSRSVQMKGAHRGPNFAVMQIKMEEGAALPFHDHFEYNGLILGLEGTIHARNFEMVADELRPPEGEDFLIRETVRSTLTPGRVSTLTRRRDNIHDLRAGKGGGRVLDVFTFFPEREGSKYMAVDEKPVEDGGRIYRARWRQRR
jgi:predicted metal-dependent enzyme (double-stranded beta helix superfamily)